MSPSHFELSDAEIVERSLSEPPMFRALFARHCEAIHRYVAARVGPAAAEDLCSETFMIAFGRRGRFRSGSTSARPWLYGIASNLLLRHRAAEAEWLRRRQLAFGEPGVEDALAGDVANRLDATRLRASIVHGLSQLAEGDRDVLVLYALSGLSYPEIAAALDLRVGTVRSRLHRARGHMRGVLERARDAASVELSDEESRT